jgi:hypothetical protein
MFPACTVLYHRVEDDQELAHASRNGNLPGFASLKESLVKYPDHGVMADGRQGAHVEHRSHRPSATPDGLLAPITTAFPVKRGYAHQGGNLLAVERAQLLKSSPSTARARASCSSNFPVASSTIRDGASPRSHCTNRATPSSSLLKLCCLPEGRRATSRDALETSIPTKHWFSFMVRSFYPVLASDAGSSLRGP